MRSRGKAVRRSSDSRRAQERLPIQRHPNRQVALIVDRNQSERGAACNKLPMAVVSSSLTSFGESDNTFEQLGQPRGSCH